MNDYLWRIIEAISAVALVPFIGFLTTLAIQKIKMQSQKIKGNKEEEVRLTISLAVAASEQLYKAGKIADKKGHATATVKRVLENKKLNIDDELLSELIEAEVWNSMNAAPVVTTTSSTTTSLSTTSESKPSPGGDGIL